jgi:hypothetical protein
MCIRDRSKPKCQATTAKGTKCTKCAVGEGPFCSIHMKKIVDDGDDATTVVAKEAKGKAKGKAAEAKTKGKAKAKTKGKAAKKNDATKVVAEKHDHGLDADDDDDKPCELCDKIGAPFEVPEYECGALSEEDFEEDDNVEKDPDFVVTTTVAGEEDFDDSDNERDSVDYEFEED